MVLLAGATIALGCWGNGMKAQGERSKKNPDNGAYYSLVLLR